MSGNGAAVEQQPVELADPSVPNAAAEPAATPAPESAPANAQAEAGDVPPAAPGVEHADAPAPLAEAGGAVEEETPSHPQMAGSPSATLDAVQPPPSAGSTPRDEATTAAPAPAQADEPRVGEGETPAPHAAAAEGVASTGAPVQPSTEAPAERPAVEDLSATRSSPPLNKAPAAEPTSQPPMPAKAKERAAHAHAHAHAQPPAAVKRQEQAASPGPHVSSIGGSHHSPSRPITPGLMNVTIVRDSAPTEEELELAQLALETNSSHVLAAFRRGHDNSHDNRMREGSYSRYLQSTRTLTGPQRLVDTFYGTAPTIGTVPRNVASARAPGMATASNGFGDDTHHSGSGGDPRAHDASAWGGSTRHSRATNDDRYRRSTKSAGSLGGTARSAVLARAAASANNGSFDGTGRSGGGGTQRSLGTVGGGTMLRREADLLSDEAYGALVAQRDRRRKDVRHCKPHPPRQEYVYYNHASKRYRLSHEQPPDALRLMYNDLYDYGPDGTRMSARQDGAGGESSSRRNPHAQPPITFGQLQRTLRVSQRPRGQTAPGGGAHPRAKPLPASSLANAKVMDVGRLHCSQFRQTRTIEEVIAGNAAAAQHCEGGIAAALRSGKLREDEVAEPLRQAVSAADAGAAEGSAVGGRALTALPSVKSTAATDGAKGLSANGGKAYGVSRLTYTPRLDPATTPGAYVR